MSASVIGAAKGYASKKNPHPSKPKGAAPASATYSGSNANAILRSWLMSERISRRTVRHPPVDMVRATSSQSRVESRKLGRAYIPLRAKRLCSRNFVTQRLRIRKALGSMTRITLHVTTRQVQRLRALRIFFRSKKGIRKECGTSPRMIWRDAPLVTSEDDEGRSPRP